MSTITLNNEQQAMLNGEQGLARQMGMRLLLDMAAAAGATELIPVHTAHLSGVSPLTGGLGLRQFLARLAADPGPGVAVPTTLNSAGCDEAQFAEMRITAPDFLEHNHEIVALYTRLGVQPTQSCTPYEWEGVVTEGTAAWAESNAICFGNSYCGLTTNRESGLSALACALTGYTPKYGLLAEGARRPNLEVTVTAVLHDPTDFSILGDWIGKQRQSHWKLPLGPIPLIKGLPADLNHEQRKALTAAAANYGCPLLYIEGLSDAPEGEYQDHLVFDEAALAQRYADLRPSSPVSLITIGCPQASVGELRATAELLRGRPLPPDGPPVWVFTSAHNKAIAEKTGLAEAIRASGALLLENTCPEVVPYDQSWVRHVLTNSMKAEHYIKSGLNGIPTSVMKLADCVRVARGEWQAEENGERGVRSAERGVRSAEQDAHPLTGTPAQRHTGAFAANGRGLPSQPSFTVRGEAFVTDAPIPCWVLSTGRPASSKKRGIRPTGKAWPGKSPFSPRAAAPR